MIEVKINGVVKWQVNEYTFVDPQMGLRSISLTVTHPSDNATVPSFIGAYVEYEGERYDIVNSKPTAEKGIDSINYKYNLIFNGQEAELQKRKIRNLATVGVDTFISQGTSFSLYADINQFKQLLENNLKYYFGSKWTINLGSTTSESVMVSVNNMFIWDLLLKTFEYYGLRWNITGNTINIGYTPDVIQHVFDYGYSGGLVKITRTAQSESTINRLIGVGGSRNVPINYFTNRYSDFPVDPNPISGDVNIKNIMPKVFRDSVIAGTLPYIDYVEDAALVAADGVKEDALDPNEEIYPSIAGVEVAGLGRIDQIIAASAPTANTPDDAGYSPTFDIWVKDIGFDLADNQYTATQDAKISFTSGMLAGYEFVILATNGVRNVVVDTSKSYGGVSSKYKITLINSSEDFTATGRMLPNSVIKAMAGDSFVIYDINMPQTYVELAELRVQNWLNEQLLVKKVEKPTYAIEPTDTFFEENITPESDGKTIREKLKSGNKLTVNNTKVTDGAQELHINNITIQYGGLLPKYSFVVTDKVSVQGSAIARLTNEIQKTDNSVRDTDKKIVKLQQYSDRQWKEIQETITLLGAAIDGFSTGVNPITVQTMQLLVGNESLQFRFVSSKTTPVAVSHAFNWDDVLKSFTTTSGIIQHMTLGITEISSNHPVSAYKFWDIASYSNNTLVAEKPYYLYAKCSRTTSGAVFLLSDVPIGTYDDANYYYFLTGILNSENSDGGRSFVSLYGFTEILPGRITTDKIVSSDGLTYFDMLNGVIGGKIRFASTGGGETSLAEWADGTSQDIQDAQAAANAAALAAQQAIDDAAENVGLINTEVGKLQAQIDGEVSNWFYPYSPTLANYPASDWTTNTIKDRHIGDTFTNTAQAPATDAGKSWRFVVNAGVYSWTQIADSDAVLALQKAAQAQSTADGKSTTYLIQPTSYKLGDMWVLAADQTVNGVAYKSGEILTATQDSTAFVQAHWVKKVRYTDDTAVNNLQIGGRNLIAKRYIKDWNLVNSYIVVQGSDDDGDYLRVNQATLYATVGGGGAYNDIFQGKISYNENTQYALKVRWKIAAAQVYPGLMLRFNYSDGTYSGYISLNGSYTTLIESSIISEAGKTVIGISCAYGDGTNLSLIYDIQMTEGNKHTAGYSVAPEDVQATIDAAVVKATYWSVKASAPVIYKDAINASTSGTHTPVTISGELRSGTTTTSGGFITVTPNGGTEGTATASPVTIAPANGDGKTSYTVKLYDTASKTTLLDTMTIPVVFKGASGVNAINVVLSNEADVLPASTDGTVSDYSGSGTTIRVFEGSTELDYDGIGTANGKFNVTASATGITTGAKSESGLTCVFANASSMTSDNATITFTIAGKTANGSSFSITKTQSFAKSRTGQKGDTGASAPLLYLSASAQVMKCNPDNTPQTGQTISIEAKLQNVSGTATFVATPYNDAGTAQTPVTLGGTGNTRTLTNAQWLATFKRVEVVATLGSLTDKVTIYRVADGATGDAGQNAIVGLLTNESVTLQANNAGVVSSFTPANGEFWVYNGVTKVTSGITFSKVSETGCTAAITSAGAYSVSAMSADNATVLLRAVYSGVTIDKVLTLSKSRAGANGVSITGVDVEFAKNTTPATAPTTGWTTTAPTLLDGEQLWTRTKTTYSSGNPTYSTPANITPKKGDTGAVGQGIDSVTEEYAISTSKTVQPTTGWSTTQPAWIQGQYIWSRVKVVYKNPAQTIYTGYAVSSEWEAVNNLEIGGVNILSLSDWEFGSGAPASPAGTTWGNLKADSTIRIRTKNLVEINGKCALSISNPDYRFLVYLFDANQQYLGQSTGEITWRQEPLYLPSSTKYIAILISKVDNTLLTVADFSNSKLKLERGDKVTGYSPSPKDVQASIDAVNTTAADAQAKANAAKAITDNFGTQIGGVGFDSALISTVLILLRELNSIIETAGISGIQGDGYSPSYWSGGTYSQALAFSNLAIALDSGVTPIPSATLNATMANIVHLHNGIAKIGKLIIGSNGNIYTLKNGIVRFELNANSLPYISSLRDQSEINRTANNTSKAFTINSEEYIFPNSIEVVEDNSTVTVQAQISATAFSDDNPPVNYSTSVFLYLIDSDGSTYSTVGFVYAATNSTDTFDVNSKITGVAKGFYKLKAIYTNSSGHYAASGSVGASVMTSQFKVDVSKFMIGENGYMGFYGKNKYIYFNENEDIFFGLRGTTDMPGVLFSAGVPIGGGIVSPWGAKQSLTLPVNNSTGRYTIYHTVGHTNYQVSASPSTANRSFHIVSKSNTDFIIEWRTIGSTPALVNTAFDFQIIGKNYA